ncbi:uncharacterized protein [Linepithema humile]|uniref:uncharacterized protein n=1 Tax=Linepithema humile TaxID=83485 RepID=UPI0006231AA8|nr:PREDICTED: uncharacterized protein LOC105671888 [Linepithema humile]
MADEKQASCSPEDCSDKIEVSQDFVFPIFKPFSPANEYFSSIEYLSLPEFDSPSRVMPKTSKKTFLNEKSNGGECETLKKTAEENDIEFLRYKNSRMSYWTCRSEMDFARPKYRNNVSPAIENLIRIMGIPFLLTSEDSRTPMKRAFSSGIFDGRIAYDDYALLSRKRLDASFTSPKTPVFTSRRHSVNSRTLKAMLMKETGSSSSQLAQKFLSRCQSWESVDTPPSDERVVNSSRYEIKESPQCVKIAEKDKETFQETIYVSEMYFLLMASNRNRRIRMAMMSRSERPRAESRNSDSAFSELTASDQE